MRARGRLKGGGVILTGVSRIVWLGRAAAGATGEAKRRDTARRSAAPWTSTLRTIRVTENRGDDGIWDANTELNLASMQGIGPLSVAGQIGLS
jgi:hypothetical protein